MKNTFVAAALLMSSGLTGCNSRPSHRAADYIGEYIFTPGQVPPSRFADFVILGPDHIATEIRFDKSTGQVRTERVRWYLYYAGQQDIAIGDFSSPIIASGGTVKLDLDDDLGQYYYKVR